MCVRNRPRVGFLACALLSLVYSGCSDNPVDNDHEQHAEATRIVLATNGSILYAYDAESGTVTCSNEPCGLDLTLGAEPLHVEIRFQSDDGTEIHLEDLDDEFSVQVAILDADVVSASVQVDGDEYVLEVSGIAEGETALRVLLLHNDEHEDLSTPPFGDVRSVRVRVTGAVE